MDHGVYNESQVSVNVNENWNFNNIYLSIAVIISKSTQV